MPDHIILVGPRGVNLMAIADQLGEKLGLPVHSPYDFNDAEWTELGYDGKAEMMAYASGGAYAGYRLLMSMRLRAVEKLLRNNERSIMILPPNFAVQEEPEQLAALKKLLSNFSHIILCTPSADMSENAALLDADLEHAPDWNAVNAYWINNPSNERLAKQVVYTKDKTETQTRDEILGLMSHVEPADIILIGPKLTGKTTIGALLSEKLSLPQVSLDMVGRGYLSETDYDRNLAFKVWTEEGIFGSLRFMRPYEAHMVERTLQDHHNCVIDFGGGHSVYEDEAHFARVQKALAPYANVFLIMPAPDKGESIAILEKRAEMDLASEKKLQRLLITHSSYQQLAKQTIYTKDKSTEVMAAEALELLKG